MPEASCSNAHSTPSDGRCPLDGTTGAAAAPTPDAGMGSPPSTASSWAVAPNHFRKHTNAVQDDPDTARTFQSSTQTARYRRWQFRHSSAPPSQGGAGRRTGCCRHTGCTPLHLSRTPVSSDPVGTRRARHNSQSTSTHRRRISRHCTLLRCRKQRTGHRRFRTRCFLH